jgi:hypothetical protein
MTSVGLGKKRQAQGTHSYGVQGLKGHILPTARKILEHGNAIGMGLAGIITERLKEKIDFKATCGNTAASTLHLDELPVSAAVPEGLRNSDPVEIVGPTRDLVDERGALFSWTA